MMMKFKKSLLFAGLFSSFFTAAKAQPTTYSWDNLPTITQPVFKKDTFDIRDFGAIADARTLNNKAIENAIDKCSNNGGGVVLIPNGYWLSGPIQLKSNVNLHLSKNAFLQFTADFIQYKIIEGNYEGKPAARNQSPIMATGVKNIAITGSGIIDGNGDAWRMVNKDQLTEREWAKKVASGGLVSANGKTWFPTEKTKKAFTEQSSFLLTPKTKLSDFEAIKDYLRPNLVVFTNCEKVMLDGITFQNSPAWNIHPLMCTDLTMRNLKIKNPDYAQNGDGTDIESCKNVLVENCVFDVGDDAICIKSGKDEEGRKRNIATENVIIRNNTVYAGHGGFVIGSEMSGGAKNIFVSDCSFIGTDKGLRFKTTRGRGGVVEKIYIRNINMSNIVQEAIYFDMYYWTKPPLPNQKVEVPKVSEETPQFKDFYISNITCNGAAIGVFIRGLPEMMIKNIVMQDLNLKVNKAVEIKDATDILIKHSTMLTTNNKPNVYIENGTNVLFDDVEFDKEQKVMFNVNGAMSKNILLKNFDTPKEAIKVVFGNGAKKDALKY